MNIKVGDTLPEATFFTKTESGVEQRNIQEITENKKIVLFAVPGAYTPTCTLKHAPGYISRADVMKSAGVDTICCISTNDPFVMEAWGQSIDASDKILLLSDMNGEFTKKAGLEFDASGHGLGIRSRRYAMIVNNGIIEKLFVDEGGMLEESTAEKVLHQLKLVA
jgi:peroxiredoxin